MKKKVLLLIAASCMVIGGILLTVGELMGGKGLIIDPTGVQRINLVSEISEYAVDDMDFEAFDSVLMDMSNCEVYVKRSENGRFGVDLKLYTYNPDKIEFGVTDGQLIIKNIDDNVGISFNFDFFDDKQQYVYLYLPEGLYDSINVSTSNERVVIEDVEAENEIYADSSNSQISIKNVDAPKVSASSSNNKVSIENVTTEVLKLETTNGKLELKDVTADILKAETSNEKVSFDNVSGADAVINTTNGELILNEVYFDSSLDASTSNSDAKLVLAGKRDDYYYDLRTSNGKISIDGDDCGEKYKGGKGNSEVTIISTNGDVKVEFE